MPPHSASHYVCGNVAIAAQAERLVCLPAEQADTICDDQIAIAVQQWRIGDATEWQRVKFRQRWMRAMQAHGERRAAGM